MSKVYALCAEPNEHKRFRPGTRPGGIGFPAGYPDGDRGDREIVYVPNVYVPFPAPTLPSVAIGQIWGGSDTVRYLKNRGAIGIATPYSAIGVVQPLGHEAVPTSIM